MQLCRQHAGYASHILVLLLTQAAALLAVTEPAQLEKSQDVAYSFKPFSPHAVPSVAIVGTAKAGTTDLYTLLTRTSYLAPGAHKKRVKEAKLLVEDGRTLQPGHPDFNEYLLRIGHPCAAQLHSKQYTAEVFRQCLQQLAAKHGLLHTNSSSSSNSSQLPLSIDATPMYLALPKAVTALKSISNDTKIIILLRHPVDRAESLYNHRVATERNMHLPPRVMNNTISEWAAQFLDWVDNTPGMKPLLSDLAQTSDPQQQARLYQQLLDHNILGLPDDLPLTFANYNRHGHIARNIFGTALYAGALSAWRTGYFQPGRVLVVDSHAFFAQRLHVMNEVYKFVHGRPLTEAGRHIAARTAVQNARRSRGIEFSGAKLEPAIRQRLEEFYAPHTADLLNVVLPAMQRGGALVVGFEGPPWMFVQQH